MLTGFRLNRVNAMNLRKMKAEGDPETAIYGLPRWNRWPHWSLAQDRSRLSVIASRQIEQGTDLPPPSTARPPPLFNPIAGATNPPQRGGKKEGEEETLASPLRPAMSWAGWISSSTSSEWQVVEMVESAVDRVMDSTEGNELETREWKVGKCRYCDFEINLI